MICMIVEVNILVKKNRQTHVVTMSTMIRF